MIGREAEERAEAEQLALGAGRALLGSLGHRVANARVQVEHDLFEDLLLAREVEVEGALADARRLGDLHDRGVVVAELGEDLLGGLEQLLAGALAARGQRLHRTRSSSSDLTTLSSALRGSDSTKRTPRGTL